MSEVNPGDGDSAAPPADPGRNEPPERTGFWKDGLGAGVVLVVAILAAVGISGDFLPRLVRNNGIWFGVVLVVAIVITAAVVIVTDWRVKRPAGGGELAAAVVTCTMAGLLICTVVLGIHSHNKREQPGVSITVAQGDGGSAGSTVVVTAKATGSGLRSGERLLRVVGISHEAAAQAAADAELEAAQNGQTEADMGEELYRHCATGKFPDPDEIVSWTLAGPNTKGEASTESTAQVVEGTYAYFCAYAANRQREAGFNETSWAIVAAEAPVQAQQP